MRSREILLIISEGRVQSKYIKASSTLKCEVVTNKIFWQSKEVLSCLNPVWNDSKNFPISVTTLTLNLFQQDQKSKETLLGSVIISIPDLLNNRKNWWDLKSGNSSAALILLEVFLFTSPPTSPVRNSKCSLSFQITPETPKSLIGSDKLSQAQAISVFLEKLKLEFSKLGNERKILRKIQKGLIIKEEFLDKERMEIENLRKENKDVLVKVEGERKRLSLEYAELKREKYLHRTQKVLVRKKSEKLREEDRVVVAQRLLIDNLGKCFERDKKK